jgi:hypothetical protein
MTHDQRKIYWINKKLRPLLPDSPMWINLDSLKKHSSFKLHGQLYDLLELKDGAIACFTKKGLKILKIVGNSVKLIKTFRIKTSFFSESFQPENENIIFKSDLMS